MKLYLIYFHINEMALQASLISFPVMSALLENLTSVSER